MSKASQRKRSGAPAWRSETVVALVVILAVALLHAATDLFSGLERRLYDVASTQTSRTPSDRIAIIAIDDQSIANIGRWPWPREVHAQLIDKLAAAQVKTVAYSAFFFEPQTARGLKSLRGLRDRLADGASAAPKIDIGDAARQELLTYIDAEEARLDTDARLASSMAAARNVILPSVFALGESPGRPDAGLPPFAQRSAIPDTTGFGLPAAGSQQPLAALGEAAAAVAHLNQYPDRDGAVRTEPLLVNFDGHAVPSMGLMIAAHSLNLKADELSVVPGESVGLGRRSIATDPDGRVLPQFYPTRNGKAAFAVDSFYDVLAGKIPASKYRDKIVIVGATAAGVGSLFSTPASTALSPAEILAHITSSVLNGHFIAQPYWGGLLTLLVALLVAAYLVLLLPRLSAAAAAWVTGGLFVLFLGAEYGLLSSAALWLQLVFPASLLVLGYLALTTQRFWVTEVGKQKTEAESAETNRVMGLALQGQGQLDLAFDRFRRVAVSEALMDNLQSLALDFERKRQFNRALAVYEHMNRLDPDNPEVLSRTQRAKNLSETVVLASGAGHPGGTLLLNGDGIENPMLGRYQVEKELGKGAMGVVYQGRDPKIGRVVAIKTLALSAEFEGTELQDARERFFREAETAGRLQHQHIVTIFDAGEEHDLAYIAMEFLQGRDLVGHTQAGQLLPVHTVLTIGVRVALALDYAHRQHVVHRDIKPANIMYDALADSVKVTDFGIARITDASRTKTGMVLGTPSFMSPEQLAGLRVDGRSDLYSLGVSLFQLLTGTLPLKADSMAALMYQIANQPAPDVRSLRPDLPDLLTDILGRTMAKTPDERYPTGIELAQALQHVLASMPGGAETGVPGTGSIGPGDKDFEKTQMQANQANRAEPGAAAAQVSGGGTIAATRVPPTTTMDQRP